MVRIAMCFNWGLTSCHSGWTCSLRMIKSLRGRREGTARNLMEDSYNITCALAPPSTCISWKWFPAASTSKCCGGNMAGMEADATMILRNSSRAWGWPLTAMAPMFQITSR